MPIELVLHHFNTHLQQQQQTVLQQYHMKNYFCDKSCPLPSFARTKSNLLVSKPLRRLLEYDNL